MTKSIKEVLSKIEVRLVWDFFQSLLSLCCLRLPPEAAQTTLPHKESSPAGTGWGSEGERGVLAEVQGEWFKDKARLEIEFSLIASSWGFVLTLTCATSSTCPLLQLFNEGCRRLDLWGGKVVSVRTQTSDSGSLPSDSLPKDWRLPLLQSPNPPPHPLPIPHTPISSLQVGCGATWLDSNVWIFKI